MSRSEETDMGFKRGDIVRGVAFWKNTQLNGTLFVVDKYYVNEFGHRKMAVHKYDGESFMFSGDMVKKLTQCAAECFELDVFMTEARNAAKEV